MNKKLVVSLCILSGLFLGSLKSFAAEPVKAPAGAKFAVVEVSVVVANSKKVAALQKEQEKKMQDLANNFKYQSLSFREIKVISRGTMQVYGQTVPYAKFEATANKLPFSDLAGIVASVKTSDGSEKLALAVSEKKRYSQLITDEFYKNVTEK